MPLVAHGRPAEAMEPGQRVFDHQAHPSELLGRRAAVAHDARSPGPSSIHPATTRLKPTQGGAGGGERAPSKVDRAEALLRELLAAGPVPEAEIMAAMRQNEFGEATVKEAKTAIGVVSRKRGFAGDGRWTWAMPGAGTRRQAPQWTRVAPASGHRSVRAGTWGACRMF